jgi:hypothetical protein
MVFDSVNHIAHIHLPMHPIIGIIVFCWSINVGDDSSEEVQNSNHA